MKKIVKVSLLIIVAILSILLLTPLIFKSQIKELVQKELNGAVNAKIHFDDVSISLIRNFPDAAIEISELLVTNYAPFENDTLVYLETVYAQTSLSDIINGKPNIKEFSVDNALIQIKTNKNGVSNYDIATSTNTTAETDTIGKSQFALDIHKYSFNNVDFKYEDEKSNIVVDIKNFNHSGAGSIVDETILLNTQSNIEAFNFYFDGVHYFNNLIFDWKAIVDLNLETLTFTFKDNNALLNDLNLSFGGFVQYTPENIGMDIDFASKQSKFKSLLSLIPSAYASNFKDISTTGALDFKGNLKGNYRENEIPKFDVVIDSKDASFKYPDLPKKVEHIFVQSHISNQTGNANDTKVEIKKFGFQIDQDVFAANGVFTNLIKNPTITTNLQGIINLDNLSKAYPVPVKTNFKGILEAHLKSSFDLKAVDQNNFKKIKSKGNVSVKNFETRTDMLPNQINIEEAVLNFNSDKFTLTKFIATTGQSDLNAEGSIKNLYAYLFDNKDLIGNFRLKSNKIDISDLVTSEEVNTTSTESENQVDDSTTQVKIPAQIDANIALTANSLLYDNHELNQVKGKLRIKDQKAIFENTTAEMLGGKIELDGTVDTKTTPSKFNMAMKINKFDITKSYNSLELFASVAPFVKAIDGDMSTNFSLKGDLGNDFFPIQKSLKGKADADLFVNKVNKEDSKALSLIDNKISFVDLSKLDLKQIKAQFSFENEKVAFKPFQIASFDGNPIQFGGSHSFNNEMDYTLKVDLPAKYFGSDAATLIASLSETDKDILKAPFSIHINGEITSPKIKPNLKDGINFLTATVAKKQKEKLMQNINKEKDKILDKIFKKETTKENDSLTKNKKDSKTELKKAAGNLLKSLF